MYFPEKSARRNKNNSTCYLCDTQCSSQVLLAFHFERKHPGKKPYRFDLNLKSGIQTKAMTNDQNIILSIIAYF